MLESLKQQGKQLTTTGLSSTVIQLDYTAHPRSKYLRGDVVTKTAGVWSSRTNIFNILYIYISIYIITLYITNSKYYRIYPDILHVYINHHYPSWAVGKGSVSKISWGWPGSSLHPLVQRSGLETHRLFVKKRSIIQLWPFISYKCL